MRLRNWLSLLLLLLATWAGAETSTRARHQGLPSFPSFVLQASPFSASLRVYVAPDGATRVNVSDSGRDPNFERKLVKWLEKEWRWIPATRDGKPVASIERLKLKFEVDPPPADP